MNVSNGDQESGISKTVSLFGKACGVGVAILLTPAIFMPSRAPLHEYLSGMWGDGLASLLTWVMGCVEAVLLYSLTALLVASLVTYALAWLAAKRFAASLK